MSSESETIDRQELVATQPAGAVIEAATVAPPDITLLFDGLFYICFAEPRDSGIEEAQIGVLSTVLSHELSITITGMLNGTTPVSSQYPLDRPIIRLIRSIIFRVEGQNPGVTIYAPAIDRRNREVNPESFKWVIDFENAEMHNRQIPIRPGIFKPIMFVRAGEFFTHAVTVQTSYDRVDINGRKTPFGFVAQRVGVRLNLPSNGKAVLEVDGQFSRTLAKSPAHPQGLSTPFTIHLDNRCPKHKLQSPPPEPLPVPSDLHFYYQSLNVGAAEWFDLQPQPGAPGAPPAICYPTTGSQTRTIPA